MHRFRYVGNKLFCEGVAVESLAHKFGTPLYVYSQAHADGTFPEARRAPCRRWTHLICFAVKSNSNLSVLRTLANLGSGFDIVSGGELQRVIAAGGDPRRCVFAGVGKTEAEIEFALQQEIYSFNAESEPELQRINRMAARLKKIAPVAVRVNPNVAAHTHAKITTGTYENKFGIAFEQIEGVYARARRLKNLRLRGLQMHIGSQITTVVAVRKGGAQSAAAGAAVGGTARAGIFQHRRRAGHRLSSPRWRAARPAGGNRRAARNILTPEKYAARSAAACCNRSA